ncbi:MAG: ATP-grasp domain-containing protein [Chitinophagales bacterium]
MATHKPIHILLTGARAPATLHLARLLHKAGCKVFVADTFLAHAAGYSNVVSQNLLIPSPTHDFEAFRQKIISIIIEFQIDFLVPTCEEVFYISMLQDELQKHTQVFTSPIEVLKVLHSKYDFVQLLTKLHLPSPQTFIATNQQELEAYRQNLKQYVLKPEYSRFADKIVIDSDGHLLKQRIDFEVSPSKKWVVQSYIEGAHFCSYSIVKKGKLLAHTVYPVGYRVKQGAALYFTHIDIPEIETAIRSIAQELNYTGHLAFDFIHSNIDNLYYAIECNPRLTSGIHLFEDSQKLAYIFTQPSPSFASKPLYGASDSQWMISFGLLLYALPKVKSIKEMKNLFLDIKRAKDVVFSWKDLKPFIKQFSSLYHFYRLSRQEGISLLEASTYDIEWNGTTD